MNDLPLIGITMGDPSGIGPEIIVKALADEETQGRCWPVVLGDLGVLSRCALRAGEKTAFKGLTHVRDWKPIPGRIPVLSVSALGEEAALPGRPTLEGGKAMVEYILRAVDMTMEGELEAMVTCPISKALMHRAGYRYDGHTELISQVTKCRDVVMMLAGERLRVALVTIHRPLKDVPAALDQEKILKTILITAQALSRDFGLPKPRVGVAALNPHAGEEGLFGREEMEIIGPAVKRAGERGLHVEGPLPADTLFYWAAAGRFDAVVAMYHDQGLIALKLLHFSDGVNVTLGLPIIRTSVDHGTAYDIAGTGRADPSSLKAAVKMAAFMVKNRRAGSGPKG